ncbi:MAG: response regulator [Planctomycetota bacterium]
MNPGELEEQEAANTNPGDSSAESAQAADLMNEFSAAVDLLCELSHGGMAEQNAELQVTIEQLSSLAENVESSLTDFNDDDPDVIELLGFVVESCDLIRHLATGDGQDGLDEATLVTLQEEVEQRLESQASDTGFQNDFEDAFDDANWDDEDDESGSTEAVAENSVAAPSQEEIAQLLSQLSAQTDSPPAERASEPSPEDTGERRESNENEAFIRRPAAKDAPKVGNSNIAIPEPDEVEVDEELREAFMDDATRGLESMEQALLDLETNPGDAGVVKTIGRELHTIKGASASIGLANLASYIHEVEELIRETQDAGNQVTPELLLPHVDLIQARVDGKDVPDSSAPMTSPAAAAPPAAPAATGPAATGPTDAASAIPTTATAPTTAAAPATPAAAPARPAAKSSESHADDETVRVKASQLNRLMDMLSELVMLRNQRDTEISELKGIHDELIHSVTRIRMLSHEGEALLAGDNLANPELAEEGVSFSHLNEVANDVLESAQRLRDCYRPVADGNQAVSQFIRNFRLELVQLRRMPVSGLFRRLHRAISDAARSEQKQVRVELIGDDTGIERSLQERIFEPLLHIVRNSVSHGIETPDQRAMVGKATQGVIQLHAHSGPDLLVIEVRDDGSGLDYDAIRRRGIERGLIDGDKSVSHAELARLIFNPGFSTKDTASQISGRGVGMDVVASTLERMRGWVEVESEHGLGSTIRLSLPLPSMIQHAMVFRSRGQLFALPAQAVRRTGQFDAECSPIDLNELLALYDPNDPKEPTQDPADRPMIELAAGGVSADYEKGGEFALLVDHVLGPEEVVVRPMPPMLKSHPLCSGATLSGMGEVVLLLDPRQLASNAVNAKPAERPASPAKRKRQMELPKVLVVDDSKSARLRVTRALANYPVTPVEVADGQAAIEMLARERFVAVFSDIDMPRMSGLELLQRIKGEPRLESLPVIMISSRSVETMGTQARQIGALEYIQKPLTPERLEAAVAGMSWAKP